MFLVVGVGGGWLLRRWRWSWRRIEVVVVVASVKTTMFSRGRAVEEHAKGFATTEMDDGAGGGTTTWASGDGALRRQKLELVKSGHILEVCFSL